MNLIRTLYYALLVAFPTGWSAFKLILRNFPSAKELPESFEVEVDIEIHFEIKEIES